MIRKGMVRAIKPEYIKEYKVDGKNLEETIGAGNVIIFPSYMSHKVEEVTKGTRNSLVVWGIGEEPFK